MNSSCGFHLGNCLPPKKGWQAKPALRSKVMNGLFPKPFRNINFIEVLEKSNTFLCTLTPVEGSHAVDIDEGNQPRQDKAENRLHPRAHLQTLTAICFCKEVIPAPAELITAEESKHQRAKRQNIIGNKEVPEIQPCCTFCEGLKMNDAEAQP